MTSPSDAGASPGEGALLGEALAPGPVARRANAWPTKTADIDAIYAAYPLHKAPRKARAAIEQAVRRVAKRPRGGMPLADAAAWLLGRTRLFAESAAAQRTEFVKYPQGWFGGDCFDEDPKTWAVPRGTPGVEARAGPSPMQQTAAAVLDARRKRRERAPERAIGNGH